MRFGKHVIKRFFATLIVFLRTRCNPLLLLDASTLLDNLVPLHIDLLKLRYAVLQGRLHLDLLSLGQILLFWQQLLNLRKTTLTSLHACSRRDMALDLASLVSLLALS